MTRTGTAAEQWGRGQITHPTPGAVVAGATTWHRLCKAFVRACFDVPSDGTLTAGAAWDRAHFRHRESDPTKIPGFVPVFFELPTVEDHVAFTLPGGKGECITTDYPANTGLVRVAKIADIARDWHGFILGWSEDIDGARIWTPPAPPPPPDPVEVKSRVQRARGAAWDAILLLDEAADAGRGEAVQTMRDRIRRDLRRGPKK